MLQVKMGRSSGRAVNAVRSLRRRSPWLLQCRSRRSKGSSSRHTGQGAEVLSRRNPGAMFRLINILGHAVRRGADVRCRAFGGNFAIGGSGREKTI